MISFDRARISLIRKGAFKAVAPRLKTLELRTNLITDLDPEVFEDLEHLQVLDLSKNKFNAIVEGNSTLSTDIAGSKEW